MKKFKSALFAMSLLGFGSVNAGTVLEPTDGDVNFLDITTSLVNWDWTLYMFDDSAASINFHNTANGLDANNGLEVVLPSIVGISGPVNLAGDHIATSVSAETLTLTESDNFTLAVRNDSLGLWIEDAIVEDLGANTKRITFEFTNPGGEYANQIATLAVDVEIVPVSAVPVPAAVWLFGSGALALFGWMRRKES